jgi:hypothetical protein
MLRRGSFVSCEAWPAMVCDPQKITPPPLQTGTLAIT